MNLYGMIRFYTAFSGRLMGEGSIFKLEPIEKLEGYYRLGEPIITDRVINLGLVNEERLNGIVIPDVIFEGEHDYKIHIFSESSDENVKLLIDLKGIEGVWNL